MLVELLNLHQNFFSDVTVNVGLIILLQAESRLPDHLIDHEKVKEVEDKLLGESPRYIYSQIAR